MSASSPQIPSFKWAEDKKNVYITVELGNVKNGSVTFDKDSIKFHGTVDTHDYALDLKLKKTIDPSKSTYAITGRQVEIVGAKETASKEFWQVLLADKNAYKGKIKCDWDKWRDEDEDDSKPAFDQGFGGMGGMPGMGGMGGMPGMGGMGGMGGMDFASMMGGMGGMGGMDFGGEGGEGDSDDEDLPDLEQAPKEDAEQQEKTTEDKPAESS